MRIFNEDAVKNWLQEGTESCKPLRNDKLERINSDLSMLFVNVPNAYDPDKNIEWPDEKIRLFQGEESER